MRLSLLHLRPLPERIAKLKDVPLFAQLNKRELSTVGRLLHEREFKAGEGIFDEGEEGQGLYVVFSGEVVIARKARPGSPLAELGGGGFFWGPAPGETAPPGPHG